MASLVYHSGALGDFITTLPAIRLWKRAHAEGPLVLLGRPEHGLLAGDLFHETWDASGARFASLFSKEPSGRAAAECLPGVDSALVFAAAASPLWTAVSGLGLREAMRQDPFPSAESRGETHIVDYHLELFGDRVHDKDRTPRIAVPGTPRKLVAVHHGSGSVRKNWPRERFEELAEAMRRRGWPVAWIVGPADDDRGPRGESQRWISLPLPELARRLAGCRLFVGNDSGVSHLAAAVGCPTVALFGSTNAAVWAPRGPRVTVVRHVSGRINDISLNEVLGAAWNLTGEGR
jgi:heptosyltransferase III